jgi:glycosyltransferase involved in cell wall biosynthesis
MPKWAWRWGLKDAYGLEQFSFWRHLWPQLRRGGFDILHVQDPMVARWCRRCRGLGLIQAKEILAHGTEESLDFLMPLDNVQHLALWHLQESEKELRSRGITRPNWVTIPNFVDGGIFRPPADQEERLSCRKRLGIPEGGLVLGCVAAVKKDHKRIDYLIREFAQFLNDPASPSPVLVIAGSRQQDTDELSALAHELAQGRVRIITDLPREDMPDLYRCMDVFVLTSLFEMMPIAVLESLASGVPVVANQHPVLEWMVGDGGVNTDMRDEGGLVACLSSIGEEWIVQKGRAARERAIASFSRESVVGAYIEYYSQVAQV